MISGIQGINCDLRRRDPRRSTENTFLSAEDAEVCADARRKNNTDPRRTRRNAENCNGKSGRAEASNSGEHLFYPRRDTKVCAEPTPQMGHLAKRK